MEFKTTLAQLNHFAAMISTIPEEQTAGSQKENELHEYEFVNMIFQYCLRQNYNYRNFPSVYSELIAQDPAGFYDLLDLDIKHYFIYLIADEKEDVFGLLRSYCSALEGKTISAEACKAIIQEGIKTFERRHVSFEYLSSEGNSTN